MNQKRSLTPWGFAFWIGLTILMIVLQPVAVDARPLAQVEEIRTSTHPQTGMLSFLGADPGRPIQVAEALLDGLPPSDRALLILEEYGPQFGITNPRKELTLMRERTDPGLLHARLQQIYQGVPVFGGEIIVNMDEQGGLTSISGEVSPELSLSTQPAILTDQARQIGLNLIADAYAIPTDSLTATEPALWILDERLIQPFATQPPHLVWRLEIISEELPIRELVLVNATNGNVSLHFNQIDTAWTTESVVQSQRYKGSTPPTLSQHIPPAVLGTPQLETYSANNTDDLDLIQRCTNNIRDCGSADIDANNAHAFAFDTYKAYEILHGRDSINDSGMTIISTVDYCEQDNLGIIRCPFENAFWNGAQMVYGDDFAVDDVVGHELTHGITKYESRLFYWYQSGAINESFSDMWGEYVDVNNTAGIDAPWQIGEDLPGGAIRDMQNPSQVPFNDPDKMSSTNYYEGDADYGGVHTNNGVNNKAVFLMVAGGKFGTKTYSGIGWDKTLDIYYRAQTTYLSSGSDYLDLYNAIDQSCRILLSWGQVTGWDCQQVRNALDAVEMNKDPATDFNPDANLCPTGSTLHRYLFEDYMEDESTSSAVFTKDILMGADLWTWEPGFSASKDGLYGLNQSLFANQETIAESDVAIWMEIPEEIPSGEETYLHFAHATNLPLWKTGLSTYAIAGGVVEYSTDGGNNWVDALDELVSDGKFYANTIRNYNNSLLYGRMVFTGISHGYVDTRLNLTPLAGENVKFRWRFATGSRDYTDVDNQNNTYGWWVDDVRIYTCAKTPAVPILSSPINNAFVTNAITVFDWKDVSPAPDHYQIQVSTEPGFYSILDDYPTTASGFTLLENLAWNATYYWRVRSINSNGFESPWSTTGKFRTKLQYPNLLSPGGMLMCPSTDCTLRPKFDWTTINGAVSYTIQVSTSSSFTSYEINVTTPTKTSPPSEYTHTSDLKKANTTYYWHVKANSATACNCASDWSLVESFTSANPPTIPTLVSPANKVLITDYTPYLDWNPSTVSGGATLKYYEIVVSQNADLSAPIIQEYPTSSNYTPASDLLSNKTYYWRVRGWNTNNHISAWSATWYFKTSILPPVLLSPAYAATTESLQPLLDWQDVTGASEYTVEVSRSIEFTSKDYSKTTKISEFPITKDLYAGTEYFWRVKTNNPNGPSAWVYRSFYTGTPPTIPKPAYPIDNALIYNYTGPLLWSSSSLYPGTSFDHYEFVIATDANFKNIYLQDTNAGILNNRYDILSTLNPNYTYYWRVRAYNTFGQYSAWSETEKFRTAYSPPFLEIPMNGETVSSGMPNFMWSHYETPNNGYLIQVANNTGFTNPIINTTAYGLSYQSTKELAFNETYYWRVQVKGANGPSYWSGVRTFYTGNYPAAPTLSKPAMNSKPTTLTPKFDWNAPPARPGVTIASYFLQVSQASTFGWSDIYETGITDTEFTPSVPLAANVKYYWRVYAISTDGFYSVPSSVWTFTTLPTGPSLITPLDGETVSAFTFQWSAVSNAKNYSLQVSTTSDFSSLVLTKTITGSTSYTPIENLPYDTALYWRVKANFTIGTSAWSEIFTFRIY
jgi:bacillolysin